MLVRKRNDHKLITLLAIVMLALTAYAAEAANRVALVIGMSNSRNLADAKQIWSSAATCFAISATPMRRREFAASRASAAACCTSMRSRAMTKSMKRRAI